MVDVEVGVDMPYSKEPRDDTEVEFAVEALFKFEVRLVGGVVGRFFVVVESQLFLAAHLQAPCFCGVLHRGRITGEELAIDIIL